MPTKSFPVPRESIKAGTDDGLQPGQFRALVSVFGNKDSYGDVVVPGAFTDTLADWKSSGDPIPVYWSHQMQDPDMNIGWLLDAQETDKGLEVLAQLDVEEGGSPKAAQAYRLLKGRRVKEFSFAYDVLEGGPVEKDGDTFFELRKLKLYEVGPTPVGANPDTELVGVKYLPPQLAAADLAVKAGRVLSAKNEDTLREALAALQTSASQIKNVLAAVTKDEESKAAPGETTAQEKASGDAPAKDEEPTGAKSEEPNRRPSVETWAALISLTDLEGTNA